MVSRFKQIEGLDQSYHRQSPKKELKNRKKIELVENSTSNPPNLVLRVFPPGSKFSKKIDDIDQLSGSLSREFPFILVSLLALPA